MLDILFLVFNNSESILFASKKMVQVTTVLEINLWQNCMHYVTYDHLR
jgi:hypothetical protein